MAREYKILVVDDEPEILNMIQRYLKMEGYVADVCQNPKEALAKIDRENYKILITDLVMPEMSGVELIKQAKQMNGFLQIIAITGFVKNESIMAAFRYGANNCFMKPLDSLTCLKTEIDASIAKLERITEVLQERLKLK